MVLQGDQSWPLTSKCWKENPQTGSLSPICDKDFLLTATCHSCEVIRSLLINKAVR